LSSFSYVVSAFRRTVTGPAKAGHYVLREALFKIQGSASATYSAGSFFEPIGTTIYCLPFSM
jgi:hypothetical protein